MSNLNEQNHEQLKDHANLKDHTFTVEKRKKLKDAFGDDIFEALTTTQIIRLEEQLESINKH